MNPLQQKKDGWCGPAAVSFALLKLGKYIPQEKIAKETETSIKKGVDPFPLVSFIKSQGFKTNVYSDKDPNATLSTLGVLAKRGNSILVDYLAGNSMDDGHYVVLQSVQGEKITVFDPQLGENKELTKSYFLRHWRDRTDSGRILKNWALVISNS